MSSPCIIIGDSFAKILSAYIACAYISVPLPGPVHAERAIIAVGTDDKDIDLNVARNIRSQIQANRIVWIAPYDRRSAITVTYLAAINNDGYINVKNFSKNDAAIAAMRE